MQKNNNINKSNPEQVVMNGNKELVITKAHINRIKESLLATMKSNSNTEENNLKEDIEFLLKRL